jgi:hypothetical protein
MRAPQFIRRDFGASDWIAIDQDRSFSDVQGRNRAFPTTSSFVERV